MMIWILASLLGVLLSLLGVLLVVSPRLRTFCLGAVCGLGVAGVLLSMYHQPPTQEQTREQHVGARSREKAPGAGQETAVSWVPRSGRPGTPVAPTAQAWPEAVSTPEEAAQAVQRLRVAQDVRRGQEEPPAVAVLQVDVRPPPETIPPQSATPISAPPRQAALSSEKHDAADRAAVTPALAAPTPSAPPMGRALKACDTLKAEIQAKLEAKSLTGYALTIMTPGDLPGAQIVGSCEGHTKKIVLTRTQNAP
jgi:Protein of unknown function (DUF1161)